MSTGHIALAETMLAQLREEMLEAQRARAQVIGFKITLVSTGVALIGANLGKIPLEVLAVPAVAAVFFDLLINAYSVSIKRIGLYVRHHLEPLLRDAAEWPAGIPTWESFASSQHWNSWLFLFGNLGITALAALVAGVALLAPPLVLPRVLLVLGMAVLLGVDFATFVHKERLLPVRSGAESAPEVPEAGLAENG